MQTTKMMKEEIITLLLEYDANGVSLIRGRSGQPEEDICRLPLEAV